MAIHQQKRENLLLEATAYSRRILISLHNVSFKGEPIAELFAGVRADGRWSLYFDESPVIQFDQQELLRRLFVDDQKLAAAGGRLVQLVRRHAGGRIQHAQQPLDEPSQGRLLSDLQTLLGQTYSVLQTIQTESPQSGSPSCRVAGVIPGEDPQIYQELVKLLDRRRAELKVAESL